MLRDPSTYVPYINPAREIARKIRDDAYYEAKLELGINSDSLRDMMGLHDDAEYCYYLRVGEFMPQYPTT